MKNLFNPKSNNVIIRLNHKCKNTCVRFTCMLPVQSTKVPRIIHPLSTHYPPK